MMTNKELERFMPREEAKMRKWGNRQRNLEELIDFTDVRLRMPDLSVDEIIYFQRIKGLLLMLKDRIDAHYEKWQNRMREKQI